MAAPITPSPLDDALLLITKLVTNAVLHGGPTIVLSVDCDGGGLQVRVRDGPPPRRYRARPPPTRSADVA